MIFKATSFIFLVVLSLTASAQIVTISGIDRDGYGGTYQISGSEYDGGTYWWMCACWNVYPSSSYVQLITSS